MSVWSKVIGTIETVFQIGLGGPKLKANGANVDLRNAADSAYVNLRVLDPAAAQDAASKNYVDSGTGGGIIREIRFALANTPASQSSTATIPANAVVVGAQVEITTPFSAGATIAVGQTGSTSLLMGTTDSNPQAAGVYEVSVDQSWGGSALAVLATIAGSPAAGVGVVIVRYTTPAV